MEFADISTIKKEKNPYTSILESREFEEWFSRSVVKNQEGEPLLVFHSTTRKNWEGQDFQLNSKSDDWTSYGVFFSSDRKSSRDYFEQDYQDSLDRFDRLLERDLPIDERKVVMLEKTDYIENHDQIVKTFNCFLNIKNPLILDNHQQLMELSYSGVTREMIKEKYDGIIISHDSNFSDQYIALDPNQIWMLPSDLELHNNK